MKADLFENEAGVISLRLVPETDTESVAMGVFAANFGATLHPTDVRRCWTIEGKVVTAAATPPASKR